MPVRPDESQTAIPAHTPSLAAATNRRVRDSGRLAAPALAALDARAAAIHPLRLKLDLEAAQRRLT